jgi:signal transduction histidine kinase
VDDDVIIARVVEKYLNRMGFECHSFEDSWVAMAQIPSLQPDIILLDYMMPNLNGPDFCRLLKHSPVLAEIPVIFITSLESNDTIINAFDAGAVDYVIKPVNTRELVVRIRNHLELAQSRRQIRDFADQMERLAEDRARQLVIADRLSMMGTLAGGVIHEIDHPNAVLSSNLLTLSRFWDQLQAMPHDMLPPESRERWSFIASEMPGLISSMRNSVESIRHTVDNLRTFNRREMTDPQPFLVREAVDSAMKLCQPTLTQSRIEVRRHTSGTGIEIFGDSQQFEQVVANLTLNAADAIAGRSDGRIDMAAVCLGSAAHLVFCDNGPGVEPDALGKLFLPFYTTKEQGKGTGLGLSITRNIIESHGGTIEAHARDSRRWCDLLRTLDLEDAIPPNNTGLAFHITMPIRSAE